MRRIFVLALLCACVGAKAGEPNTLVRTSLAEEREFREATKSEVAWYLAEIPRLMLQSGRSNEDVRTRVKSRLDHDLAYMTTLNQIFANLSPDDGAITWSCKANKLVEILTETIPFFAEHGELLLQGLLPLEFRSYWDSPRCLGACETRAAGHNSRELALKASLLMLTIELNNSTHIDDQALRSLEDSAFVHTTQLPKGVTLADIKTLSFFYNSTLSPVQGELAFVHGGYAFGGQVDDWHFRHLGPYGKPFGPQDCASWVSKIVGLASIMWTKDYAEFYRDFASLQDGYESVHRLTPVPISTINDVQPGMILVTRYFDLAKDPGMNTTLGTSGHAQLIVEVDLNDNAIMTLERARNLPAVEGFGVTRMPYTFQPNVKPMFFTVNAETQHEHRFLR